MGVPVHEKGAILDRVANLGDFSPENANLGIFLSFGELGDFLGNIESQL
jgi:hypothetical protein